MEDGEQRVRRRLELQLVTSDETFANLHLFRVVRVYLKKKEKKLNKKQRRFDTRLNLY